MTGGAIVSGPHAHSKFSVAQTMVSVMVCLSPATALGFYQFGWPAILLFAVTVASALIAEAICLLLARRPVSIYLFDGSAILTGWLLAMTLPPWAPWWVGTVGAFIAIGLGKHVYGGLGQNMFNPAMVARAMLLVALPVQMTTWVLPPPFGEPGAPEFWEALTITFGGSGDIDAVSGATTLGFVAAGLDGGRHLTDIMAETFPLRSLAFGHVPGSLGETSALLLFLGGCLLIAMRVIRWQTPFALLLSAGGLSAALHLLDPMSYPSPLWHLASGGLMLCAFFIATDYVTSPVSGLGQLIYGAGTGLLIVIIRTWGAFPEGAAFAVLLMNACTPVIDTYTRPRIFGRDRKGRPLELPKGARQ
ncbi:RnfABCDGE type electron transport complex subunit D [Tropicimonas marinistellae]|uniref:RnfABCDGE type electron transport complex subunit D n=1 Tax=Tropicimonas marinistellae TaxID=1739787 RepID=UPI0008364461|nr:RnfABCDGE type electron transport complex subunit D [Tropicimonas marinistellae]